MICCKLQGLLSWRNIYRNGWQLILLNQRVCGFELNVQRNCKVLSEKSKFLFQMRLDIVG